MTRAFFAAQVVSLLLLGIAASWVCSCRSNFNDQTVAILSVTSPFSEALPEDRAVPVVLQVVNHAAVDVNLVVVTLIFSPPLGFIHRSDLEQKLPAIPAGGSASIQLYMDIPLDVPGAVEVDGKIWAVSLKDGRLFVDEGAEATLRLSIRRPDQPEPQPQNLVVTVAADEQDGSDTMNTVEEAGGPADLSLREAILIANNRPGPDTIGFLESVFPEPSPKNILIGKGSDSSLPVLTDGGTELVASGRGVQLVPEAGAHNVHDHVPALRIQASDTVVRGLRIADFYEAITVTSGAVTIEENKIYCVDGGKGVHATGGNIHIVGNEFGNCSQALMLELCSESLVQGNIISSAICCYSAVSIIQSDHLTISDNEITENFIGFDLAGSQNDILRNRITRNSVNLLIAPGARDNTIANNVITLSVPWGTSTCNNYDCGVGVSLVGGDGNKLSQNQITRNKVKGISNSAPGANNDIKPPVITLVEPERVSGTSSAVDGSVVEVFSDPEDQGDVFLGSATVSQGTWECQVAIPSGSNVTATVTDLDRNTSEFSPPVPAP